MYISTSFKGINPWVIREAQQLQIEPGTSSVYVSSRSCPDLVATTTQLIAKIYGADQTEPVDMEVYDFSINKRTHTEKTKSVATLCVHFPVR